MINLLPPDLKESYHYAHRNVRLVRWAVACLISLAGLAVISTVGLIYIQQTSRSYDSQIAAAETSLEDQHLTATQTKVKDISDSLTLAVKVLSKEVLFSNLLARLAMIMPNKTVLTDLNISQTQRSVDISALAVDYNSATQVQVNLTDPDNKLFDKAEIVNITCGGPGTYPCAITIRAMFVKNNPFLFINDGVTK